MNLPLGKRLDLSPTSVPVAHKRSLINSVSVDYQSTRVIYIARLSVNEKMSIGPFGRIENAITFTPLAVHRSQSSLYDLKRILFVGI